MGTTNPAARIGFIDLGTLATTWAKILGDVRENYLPRMEWVDSSQLAIPHLNRRQNQWKLYLADAVSGDSKVVLEEADSAWIDVHDETIWLKDKAQFLWLSEQSGWRHIYLVSRDGQSISPLTNGDFDVIEVLGIDEDEKRTPGTLDCTPLITVNTYTLAATCRRG